MDKEEKYYLEIKNKLIDNEVYKRVKDYSKNKHDLQTYYNVGKILSEAQGGEERAKYGNRLIKKYSEKLYNDVGLKYSITSLKYMRQYYLFQKGQPVVAESISWSHYTILLSLNNINEINYYINRCINDNLSKRKLAEIIKKRKSMIYL